MELSMRSSFRKFASTPSRDASAPQVPHSLVVQVIPVEFVLSGWASDEVADGGIDGIQNGGSVEAGEEDVDGVVVRREGTGCVELAPERVQLGAGNGAAVKRLIQIQHDHGDDGHAPGRDAELGVMCKGGAAMPSAPRPSTVE